MADGSWPIRAGSVEHRPDDATVVLFAGGGGSSIAAEEALGRHPDAALNHWAIALSVHQRNFPGAQHYCSGALETDPRTVCPGRRIGLLWLSPDCRHFSPASGAALVSPRIRALAWAAIPWIKLRRPTVVILENVEAFLTWGPVIVGEDGKGRPDPARKGETFRLWVKRFRQCGYDIQWRVESVADHGGHTIRRRLKVIARCDGLPIVWPEASHAHRKVAAVRGLRPHRPAFECIDFTRPVYSIFMPQSEVRARGLPIKRPLEDPTYARIAGGLFRHTFNSADPFAFTIAITHQGADRTYSLHEGFRTITGAHRGEFALVTPHVVGLAHGDHAKNPGLRAWDARDPFRVTTAGGGNLGLVAAHIEEMNTRSAGVSLGGALPGLTDHAHHGLVTAFMEQANTGAPSRDLRDGVSTIVQKGCTQRLAVAQLSHFRTSNTAGGEGDLRESLRATTAGGQHQALLEAALEAEQDMAVPFSPYGDELRAFLIKYYGTATAQDLADPLATGTSRSRFGLVVVAGRAYRITDIGMRMLDPATELAAAMGVPRSYRLDEMADGSPVTKTNITKLVGNMVARQWAAKIIAANCGWMTAPGYVFNPERIAA